MIILPRSEKGIIAIHVGFPNSNQPEFPEKMMFFLFFLCNFFLMRFFFFVFSASGPARPLQIRSRGVRVDLAGLVPRGSLSTGFVGV